MLFRYFIFNIFMAVFLSQNGQAFADDSSRLKSGLYFHFPACVPDCTLEDRPSLNEDNFIEDQVVAAIDSAKQRIDFSQFTFSRDSVFRALLRAADRGVEVRGIMDRGQFKKIGDQCQPTGCDFTGSAYAAPDVLALKPSERLKVIESRGLWPSGFSITEKLAALLYKSTGESGVKPAPGKNRLVHNKFVIVDGNLLVSGSGNWSSTGMAINLENIDTVYADERPEVVKAFQCMADAVWSGDANVINRRLRACETDSVYFTPSPAQGGVQTLILSEMKKAQSSIEISMHHLTNNELVLALEEALARQVSVRIMFDNDDCMIKMDEGVRRLRDAGAEIRYLATDCSMFQLSHNKFGIFDGKIAINGSGNWSKAGLVSNYENYVKYSKPEEVGVFRAFFAKAWDLAVVREECSCNPRDESCRVRFCLDRAQPQRLIP